MPNAASIELVTAEAAAARIGVPVETLRAWADEGLVQPVPLPDGRLAFTTSHLRAIRAALGFRDP